MDQFGINFVAGNIAGWSYISVAMPLDLIKTKLQLNKDMSLLRFQNLRKNKHGFFKTFYRGASSMYLFFGSAVATEFTIFEIALKKFEETNLMQQVKLYGSGWTAGLMSSLIYTPIEYGKIKSQTAKGEDRKIGSLQRIFQIVRQEKIIGIKKIYTGLQYTIMREAFGLGIYYGGFHIFLRDVLHEEDRKSAKFKNQVASAIFAGCLYNLWAYPFDTFKTNIQSGKYNSIKQMIASKFWNEKSVRQGAAVLLLRGLMADSVNLIVYENARYYVEKGVDKIRGE